MIKDDRHEATGAPPPPPQHEAIEGPPLPHVSTHMSTLVWRERLTWLIVSLSPITLVYFILFGFHIIFQPMYRFWHDGDF